MKAMAATEAINAARRVRARRTAEEKLDELAKAIEALASAVADIERAVQHRDAQ
jgi:hypothetical protein